jgi:2-oxoglutarate ferredoxin oxidoreductase subunit beta
VANPELLVLVAGGDGDGFSIGGGHVPHAVRRNIDLTYIVMDNQVYGLTKGQLEDPVNPLLYLLAYGAGFVAQGTPADMSGLASIIEEAIRYPGFAFVNVQSPCVTFGNPEAQLRAHKTEMRRLQDLGHDPSDRLRAMDLAQHYGRELHTGVFYRNPSPAPTYEALVRERQEALRPSALPRARILERFVPRA